MRIGLQKKENKYVHIMWCNSAMCDFINNIECKVWRFLQCILVDSVNFD